MTSVIRRTQCPKCKRQGNDNSRDNLVLYSDGHKHCFACGYHVGTTVIEHVDNTEVNPIEFPKLTVLSEGIPHKGIGKDICDFVGIRELPLIDNSGEVEDVNSGIVLFPFYDTQEQLIGIKYRDFYAEVYHNKKKKDTIWFKGTLTIGGLHCIDDSLDELCLWEGETDYLTAMQCDDQRNHLWLSGSNSYGHVQDCIDVINSHKKIYIGFDNDKAGNHLTKKVTSMLPAYKVEILKLDTKDVNQLVMKYGEEAYHNLFTDTIKPNINSLITGTDLVSNFNSYIDQIHDCQFISTGYKLLDDMLNGGLTPGEVLTLTAYEGIGKSTLCANIAYNICKEHRVMWVGTEMRYTQMLRKFIERHLEYQLLNEEDLGNVDKNDIQYLADRIVFYNDMHIEYEQMIEAVKGAIFRYDIKVLFIDVLNDISGMSDWQTAQKIMLSLSDIATGDISDSRPPVPVVLVCHQVIRQGYSARKATIKNLTGGMAPRQKSTVVIVMEGDIDDTIRYLHVDKKSRMNDTNVYEGTLCFNKDKWRYEDVTKFQERTRDSRSTRLRRQRHRVPIRDRKDNIQ